MINKSTRQTSGVLEVYQNRSTIAVDKMISAKQLSQKTIDAYKELLFRIEVLEAAETLQKQIHTNPDIYSSQAKVKKFLLEQLNIERFLGPNDDKPDKESMSNMLELSVLLWLEERENIIKLNK